MFIILLDSSKNELRVVRADSVSDSGTRVVVVPHHNGHSYDFELPPGVEAFADLATFDDVEAAWSSVRTDFCPSLHP